MCREGCEDPTLLCLLHASQTCPDVLRRCKGQKGLQTLMGAAVGAQVGPLGLETCFCYLPLHSVYTLWPPRHMGPIGVSWEADLS